MQMRLCTALLAASVTLTACGRMPTTAGSPAPGALRAAGLNLGASDARAHADRFAAIVRQSFKGQISQAGAAVTLTGQDQAPVRYDFAQAPKTGMVAVSMEGFQTLVPEAKLLANANARPIPAIVVTIAVQMALGGAKALLIYYLKHPKDFNQHDAIRATLIGMGTALVHFLPHGALLDALVPIAVDMIMKIKVKDLQHIAEVAMGEVDKIVEWVKEHVLPQLGQDALLVDGPAFDVEAAVDAALAHQAH